MPSPYIKITERDESSYAVTTSNTIVALVGFAKKGPIDTPVFCTSIDDFKRNFGLTPREYPFSHLAAYRYFNQGSALWFTRIADNTALESYERVLSNNGTGVAAVITSTNTVTAAAFSVSTDYKIKITVDITGTEYQDTLTINLLNPTDAGEVVTALNNAISGSANLTGKVVVSRTQSNGQVHNNNAYNTYITFKTVETGENDSIVLENPTSGNSIISNGSVGLSFTSTTAYGTYSSPSKAIVIGNTDFATVNATKDLTSNYNLNVLVDDDLTPTTIDLAAKNKAKWIGDVAYVSTTSSGFNPNSCNIDISIDGGADTTIDLTGNLGASALKGYQEIANTGSLGAFTGATIPAIGGVAPGTSYDLIVDVDGAGDATFSITVDQTMSWTTIVGLLDTAMTAVATVAIVDGKIKISSKTYGGSSVVINPTGSTLLTAIDAIGATYVTDIETAVNGYDVVLTKGYILTQINNALGTTATASFSGNYLQVQTATEGLTGSAAVKTGNSNDASAFFGTPVTNIDVAVDGGEATTLTEMITAINEQLNTARSTTDVVYGIAYLNYADSLYYIKLQSEITGTDAKLYVNSTDGSTEDAPASDARNTVFTSGAWSALTNVDVGDNGSINSMFKFVFKEKGSAANLVGSKGCKVVFSTRQNPLYYGPADTENQKYFKDITVYFDNLVVETFKDISYDRTNARWFKTILNAQPENGGSSYVNVEWYQADTDSTLDEEVAWVAEPTTGTYLIPDGTLELDNGIDGIPTNGIVDSLYQNGVQTFSNSEIYDPHMIAVPGISSSSVINSIKNFIEAEGRQDILYVVDPPFGLEPREIADWHNGKSSLSGAPASAINSSYLALYWGWMKILDVDNNEFVWCPPSVFMLEKLTEIDNNYKPWGIPAGLNRGKVTADDYEYSPGPDERDLIYDINGDLNVNPFVDFPGNGLTIYGQKTLLRGESALNRVNVRRMVIYSKKLMRRNLKPFMFEANLPSTWARVSTVLSNIFEPIRQDGGISNYEIIFDETTTTTSLQDQGILSGIVRVTPVKAIEAIEVTFAITGQGVSVG